MIGRSPRCRDEDCRDRGQERSQGTRGSRSGIVIEMQCAGSIESGRDLVAFSSLSVDRRGNVDRLRQEMLELLDRLETHPNSGLVQLALETILDLAGSHADRLDWKILNGALLDMQRAIEVFYPYRHVRKIAIFGSARTPSHEPEYEAAVTFAQCMTARGFMAITGAGPGIMQAANEGAGRDQSFGLNIQLPFEQTSNPHIDGDPKLVNFKYFFTRKLFFLRESDAVALFPGGFGTQDEAFECLTLSQTGKFGPAPIVLLDRPGGTYWHTWEAYHREHLLERGLISPDDLNLYFMTDHPEAACDYIVGFYRIYHSSRYVGDRLVLRLRTELPDEWVADLNDRFSDILVHGRIEKSTALPAERNSQTAKLPRLVMAFNQRDLGRLHQLVHHINQFQPSSEAFQHPETK